MDMTVGPGFFDDIVIYMRGQECRSLKAFPLNLLHIFTCTSSRFMHKKNIKKFFFAFFWGILYEYTGIVFKIEIDSVDICSLNRVLYI